MQNNKFELAGWKLTTHELDKENKRFQESLTSIGNGYMGMRGMFEESYSGDKHEGIYLAGVWYPDKTRVGWWKNGYPEYFGKVINTVNFMKLAFYIDGAEVDLYTDTISDFTHELDMYNGLLTRSFIITKGTKRVKFTVQRFVSLATKELCAISVQFENLGAAATIKVASAIDANVTNEDANYDEKFWQVVEKEVVATDGLLVARTIENNFDIPQFTVGFKMTHEQTGFAVQAAVETEQEIVTNYEATIETGEKVVLEKRILVVTSRDFETVESIKEQLNSLTQTLASSTYDEIKTAHQTLWHRRWDLADVEIGGDVSAQQGIRFNIFQLFSTYYGEDARLNIGPKGFTGEKYGGATYWDTEAFAIPFYLSLAAPEVTENLLDYRHQQLPQAQHNARQQGLAGALYPMVTFTGVECHNEWEITFEEIHRNGSMVYAIYNHANYTGDESYLLTKGIDVITEISRFWADRVHFSKRQGQYMMHGVTGPNEYENNVNNNWYTNYMAQWTLRYALETLPKLSAEKRESLQITAEETAKWSDIVEKMYLPHDEQEDVFLQHDTFMDKDLTPVAELDPASLPLNQNWSWDHILRSPYIKQADVLQGVYYFPENFTLEEKKRNFDFYEPLTVHESSLSPSVHAILAAEIRYEEKAVEMYERTARLDLDNYNNDTEDGLHITSMTGSWLAIVQGFAGMRVSDHELSFKPFLPEKWENYRFHINFRGRLLLITVTTAGTDVKLIKGEPLTITVDEKPRVLKVEEAAK
ncbi:glycoside hydrolase family 65 protein [Brochothrix thermosphacta]|uniref:glycoside hydrolase family 65 protein n=1 Tax=Brochothrix thermosphacta TaxID=2756 RepID=UPI00083F718D|nr:glycoside hydrolase family 65 protein [Brochothrix thermosphacta]ODJ64859.1 maltose phosphorylase [Brochothrix thermosphacta]